MIADTTAIGITAAKANTGFILAKSITEIIARDKKNNILSTFLLRLMFFFNALVLK